MLLLTGLHCVTEDCHCDRPTVVGVLIVLAVGLLYILGCSILLGKNFNTHNTYCIMHIIHNYIICIEEHGTSHFFNRSAVAKHIFGAVSTSISRSSKCTKIVGGWGYPTGVAYSAPPDPLAGINGPYF